MREMLNSKTVQVVKTVHVGGTVYHEASWQALDSDGYSVAGPCSSERKLRKHMAWLNREIEAEEYLVYRQTLKVTTPDDTGK